MKDSLLNTRETERRAVPANTAFVYHDASLREYPATPPFSPNAAYPEYPFGDRVGSEQNRVYGAVRAFLRLAGMDAKNFERAEWNPFGDLIRPGDHVLIKPNFVLHQNNAGGTVHAVITHGSLVRAVVDYVLIALQGEGRVTIGDAPLQSADFAAIRRDNGLDELLRFYKENSSVPVELVDFRRERALMGVSGVVGRQLVTGDPQGYTIVDFGNRGMLASQDVKPTRYRVTNYDPELMREHHTGGRHEYLIARSVLTANVILSLPKMKTHRKAGVTGALKNLVGVNGNKDWLPHHARGARAEGGDEYLYASKCKSAAYSMVEARDVSKFSAVRFVLNLASRLLYHTGSKATGDPYFEGSWWGNDTIYRTVLDLNRAVLYSDSEGKLHNSPQRKLFVLVDGIVAGEGEGPLEPAAKPIGVLLGGISAAVVDAVMARLMGFDYRKIPCVREAFRVHDLPLADCSVDEIKLIDNSDNLSLLSLDKQGDHFRFQPCRSWQGYIEFEDSE